MRRCSDVHLVLSLFIAMGVLISSSFGVTLTLTEDGIELPLGEGKVILSYPKLGAAHKQSSVTIAGRTATVRYEGGAEILVEIGEDGVIVVGPITLPEDIKILVTEAIITAKAAKGGSWGFGEMASRPFPDAKPDRPHLYQGNAGEFMLRGAGGEAILFTNPATYCYNELTDNREWNWNIFAWKIHTPVNRDWTTYTYKVHSAADGSERPTPQTAAPPAAPVAKRAADRVMVKLASEFVQIDLGPARPQKLSYPLLYSGGEKPIQPHDITVSSDGTASLAYPNGVSAIVRPVEGDDLQVEFAGLTDGTDAFRMEMQIAFNYARGGRFAIGEGELKPFPAQQRASPHLYQGNAASLTLVHPQGGGMTLGVPAHSYQQLTDNRAWNWKIFFWYSKTPIPSGASTRTFRVTIDPVANEGVMDTPPVVDQLGQSAWVDYPGKVHSIDELKRDVEEEVSYYANFSPPRLDTYGGLPGSGERLGLKKTGFFRMQKVALPGGERWVMVDPAGNAFFQLGICAFSRAAYTYVEGREEMYEWLPSPDGEFATAFPPNDYWGRNSVSFHLVNMIRKYGRPMDEDRFVGMMVNRVRRFGFNSEGAFSGLPTPAHEEAQFPYVQEVPAMEWHGFKRIPGVRETWDPFDEGNVARLNAKCAERVAPRANDPLLIGYFLVNEPLYQDIPRVVPTLKREWACKRALVDMLRSRYEQIGAFNRAWDMEAQSFDELNDRGLPVRTQVAADDMKAYTGFFLETYFKLVHDTMRKYDPNHMLIGNRLQTGTANNQQLCEIAGRYLDVFSLNYYTYSLDRPFLDRLHKWTGGLPMMLTEFYWNSPDDSGLPGGVKDVRSQEERGLAYRHYVEHAAAIPYIVGVQWFTLVDQHLTGQWYARYGGENGNSGMFSVADRPWKPLVEHMAETNYRIYALYLEGEQPFIFDDPRFTSRKGGIQTVTVPRLVSPLVIDGAADGWPGYPATHIGSAHHVEGTPGDVEAAFKLAWDETNLYVLVDVRDATPMNNTHACKDLWQGDGVELFIGHEKIDDGGPMLFTDRQVLLSANPDSDPASYVVNAPEQVSCRVAATPHADQKGYTLEAAVPFAALGFEPAPRRVIRFDFAIDDSDDGRRRNRQLMWNGTARNSGDRTAWGKARLTNQ